MTAFCLWSRPFSPPGWFFEMSSVYLKNALSCRFSTRSIWHGWWRSWRCSPELLRSKYNPLMKIMEFRRDAGLLSSRRFFSRSRSSSSALRGSAGSRVDPHLLPLVTSSLHQKKSWSQQSGVFEKVNFRLVTLLLQVTHYTTDNVVQSQEVRQRWPLLIKVAN